MRPNCQLHIKERRRSASQITEIGERVPVDISTAEGCESAIGTESS